MTAQQSTTKVDINYPKLPEPKYSRIGDGLPCITIYEHQHLMRAYVDADRAARSPADSQPVPVVDRRTKQQMTAEVLRRMQQQEDGHNKNPFRSLLDRLMRNEGGYSTIEIGQLKYALDGFYGAARAPADSVTAPAYSIDADPQGIRARVADAITGALAFGAQGANPPPTGHWLVPFWETAREEASRNRPVSSDTLYLLRRLLSNQHTLTGAEFREELTKIVGEATQAADRMRSAATLSAALPVEAACAACSTWRARAGPLASPSSGARRRIAARSVAGRAPFRNHWGPCQRL